MRDQLRIGYDAAFRPFSWMTQDGCRGLLIDITRLAFARAGYDVVFTALAQSDMGRALAERQIAGFVGAAITPERQKSYDFSTTLLVTGAAWFFRAGGPCRVESLRTIATPTAGPLVSVLSRQYPAVRIVLAAAYEDAFAAVLAGSADAAALNLHAGLDVACRSFPGQFLLPEEPFHELPLALAVPFKSRSAFLERFDFAVSALHHDGSIAAIKQLYLDGRNDRR